MIRTVLLVTAATMLGQSLACKAEENRLDLIGRVAVELRDLDLHDPAAARIVLERLDSAAYEACGGDPRFHSAYNQRPSQVRKVYRDCRTDAVARAVKQIGMQPLTQAYQEWRARPRTAKG